MSSTNISEIKVNPLGFSINKMIEIISPLFQRDEQNVVLLKIGPFKFFCFRDPFSIKEIYTNKSCALYKDPKSLTWASWFMHNGLFNDRGFNWREKRLRTQPYFMPQCVPDLLNTCFSNEQNVINYVKNKEMSPTGIVDGFKFCALFTTNFALNILFGTEDRENIGFLSNLTMDAESGFTELLPLWIPTKKARKFKKTEKLLSSYFVEKARELHKNSEAFKISIAGQIIESLNLNLNMDADQDTFLSELYSVYFGFTAVSVAASWAIYHLCVYDEHKQKILAELNSQGSSNHLDMFILESLRLRPPFWGSARYTVEPLTISGIDIPKGSNLVAMRYFANRHREYWEYPETFIPTRFNEKNSADRESFVYQNFGLGPRTCIGRHLAIPALTRLIEVLLKNFDFDLIKFSPRDPILNFDFGLLPENLMFRLKNSNETMM